MKKFILILLILIVSSSESQEEVKDKEKMKKLLFILTTFLYICTSAYAQESYYCEAMSGVTTPLEKPNFLKKVLLWINNGTEKTKSISDFRIVIDGENSYVQIASDTEKTPLILFTNTDEKAELLEIGTVASSIYSIDKIHKKVLQAKNGILPTNLKYLFKIDLPYQMIMSSSCR